MGDKKKKWTAVLLSAALMAGALSGCAGSETGNPDKVKLDPDNPVTISVWNYYNGDQQAAFNALVDEFNDTEGRETGIYVETYSQGSVSDLEKNVLDSVNGEVGAPEMPNIFAAYADTAYAVDQLGMAVDLSPYFTKDELSRFIDSYIQEGQFTSEDELKIFPVAKSTEVFVLNKTDWDKFAGATGWDISELKTIEGVTRTAEAYYEWTDSLTPEKNDGKAFFGRDAMANYIIIGSMQLGTEIFAKEDGKTVIHFDKDVMKKIWDNYYVPYVKGYFSASGRFRSENIRTGTIISFVGASSGATFFPDSVIVGDTQSYPIQMQVMECPGFEGGTPYAVQQGAGMVVTKTTPEEIYASAQFLKWFTEDDRNIRFSVSSGYLPVTKAANDAEFIQESMQSVSSGLSETMSEILVTSIDTVNNNTMYTPKAFKNGTDARNILEHSLSDLAAEDRKTVVQNLEEGMKLDDAAARFVSDDYFERWYEATKAQLEELAD